MLTLLIRLLSLSLDLRLYRETPISELTSNWSLAVGASADQWKAFIESIGSAPEERELAKFLETEIFPILKNCFDTVTKATNDLAPSHLLDKELSDLSKMRQLKGLPPLPTSSTNAAAAATSSGSPNSSLPPTDNGVGGPSAVGESGVAGSGSTGSGGSSAGSNSGNSTSTCPLTPPNGTPGVNQPSSGSAAQSHHPSNSALKTSNTAPNTPCKFVVLAYYLYLHAYFCNVLDYIRLFINVHYDNV